jgi:hypothetical protein
MRLKNRRKGRKCHKTSWNDSWTIEHLFCSCLDSFATGMLPHTWAWIEACSTDRFALALRKFPLAGGVCRVRSAGIGRLVGSL